MPELAERWALVIQVYPGASADRIESQVTEILEIKLREISEIRNLNSNIRQGSATTLVELKDEVSFDLVEKVWSEVQDKLDQTEQKIPNNVGLSLVGIQDLQFQLFIRFNGRAMGSRLLY